MRWLKRPDLRSLRWQLMATSVGALLLTLVGAAAVVAAVLWWDADTPTRRGLQLQAKWMQQSLQFDGAGRLLQLRDDGRRSWIYQSAPEDLKYRVLDAAGQVLLSSGAGATALAPPGQAFDPARPMFKLQAGDLQLQVLTVPIERGDQRYYVQVARSSRLDTLTQQSLGGTMLKVTLITVGVSLLLFGAAVYITLWRTLRPLHQASADASRIEPGNLAKRLDTAQLPSEIVPLVDAFNEALGRLEHGFRVQQAFLAGAAHELKTPLALIRGQIEMDGTVDRATLLRDVDLMARQVHQLLHLAEVSEAQNYVYENTDLAAVASEVTAYLHRLADRRQVSLHVHAAPEGVLLRADRSALFVLTKNLVENAIHHSAPGGVVTLTLSADGMQVRDEGAGIADEHFAHLFTRFWRSAERRDDGAGLGLAICREIAGVHGWALAARNAAPGAEFSLRFAPG